MQVDSTSWVTEQYRVNPTYLKYVNNTIALEFIGATCIGVFVGDASGVYDRMRILAGSWCGWCGLSAVEELVFKSRAVTQLHNMAISNITENENPDQDAIKSLLDDGGVIWVMPVGGEGVSQLIKEVRGASQHLNKTTVEGDKLLDVVAEKGSSQRVKALLNAGATFGPKRFDNLLLAVERNNMDMVKLLLPDEITDEQKKKLANTCGCIEIFSYLHQEAGIPIAPIREEIERLKLTEEKELLRKKVNLLAQIEQLPPII